MNAIIRRNGEGGGSELIRLWSQVLNQHLSIPIARFLSMVRFENKGKSDDLGIEINTNKTKINK